MLACERRKQDMGSLVERRGAQAHTAACMLDFLFPALDHRNPEQNDEGGAFPRVRWASLSGMTCYSAVRLLHFYVSKHLHSYVGGVRNTADLTLIEG